MMGQQLLHSNPEGPAQLPTYLSPPDPLVSWGKAATSLCRCLDLPPTEAILFYLDLKRSVCLEISCKRKGLRIPVASQSRSRHRTEETGHLPASFVQRLKLSECDSHYH